MTISQLLQTVSAENHVFKRAFEKTIYRRDRVQKRRFWKHLGYLHWGFTKLFETTIKPQRECNKYFFGCRFLSFNWEFKMFSMNAREKYDKIKYFERREKTRWNEGQTVDENSGFANLQFFHKNPNSFIKPQP